MISSPRLFALATLLAPVVLFLVVHTAHGATRPTVRFTSAPTAVTSARSATLAIARTVHGRVRAQTCRFDRSAWKTCTRTLAARNLTDGPHTAQVRLVLRSGAKAMASAAWQVDTVAPAAPAVLGGNADWTASTAVVVTHGTAVDPAPASGIASYRSQSSIDGGMTWSSGPADDVTVTAEGETLVQFAAVDRAGNVSAWSDSAVVRLDRTAPDTPAISGAPDGWTNAAEVELSVSGSETIELQRSTDGGATWAEAGSGGRVEVADQGETLVRARACDEAGNCSAWSQPALVRIDRTAPAVPDVSGAPSGWTNAAVVTMAIAGTDAVEHQASLDGGTTWSAAEQGTDVEVTGEGETLVRARACDEAGNCSAWSQPVAVRIDRTAPSAPAGVTGGDGGDPSCLYQETQQVTFEALAATDAASGVDHYVWKLNRFNESPLALNGTGSLVHLTYNEVKLSVRIRFAAVDAAGNVGPWSDGTRAGANICLVPPV